MQSAWRTAGAGLIGNVLEWFDFAVYAYFTPGISKTFFPDSMAQDDRELLALLIFWVGFVARPIGGLVLGAVGDRIGRRALLTLSIGLMGGATLLMGLLPGYETIGIASPILLGVCRIVQGFSLGGEFTGSMVYTTELASPLMRGLVASSTAVGTTLGFILGSGVAWLINELLGSGAAADWGWRIPFVGSLLLVVAGWLLRRGIVEPEVTANAVKERAPILRSLVADWKPIAQTFGIVALTNAAYYLTFTFAPGIRESESNVYKALNTGALFMVLVAKLFGGWLSDRVGRRRLMIALTLMTLAGMYTANRLMLFGGPTEFFVGQVLLGIPLGMALGLQGAMVVEIFPLRTRVMSMSFAYGVTIAMAGGITPLIAKWLHKTYEPPTLPVFYVMIYGLIGLPIMIAMRETNDRTLAE